MSIHSVRSLLYKTAKMLGDVQALASGSSKKMSKSMGRRLVGKATGKGIRKLFK